MRIRHSGCREAVAEGVNECAVKSLEIPLSFGGYGII